MQKDKDVDWSKIKLSFRNFFLDRQMMDGQNYDCV
jgi:hypothetical protein